MKEKNRKKRKKELLYKNQMKTI